MLVEGNPLRRFIDEYRSNKGSVERVVWDEGSCEKTCPGGRMHSGGCSADAGDTTGGGGGDIGEVG